MKDKIAIFYNLENDDFFEFANKDAIPLNYCEEYLSEDTEEYIFDRFTNNYNLKLI